MSADDTAIDPTADTVPSPIAGAKLEPRGVVSSDPPPVPEAKIGLTTGRFYGRRHQPGPEALDFRIVGGHRGPTAARDDMTPPSGGSSVTPPTTAEMVNGGLAQAIRRHERTPRDAFDVFLACAEPETCYDFSSETRMDGTGSFVIEVRATPRRDGHG